MPKQNGYAQCLVTEGQGFSVVVCNNKGEILEEGYFSALDDNQSLNTLSLKTNARQFATDLMREHNLKGYIQIDIG